MTRVTFVETSGKRRDIEAKDQLSLMQTAKNAGIAMEGACEGYMACSTCHVIVDRAWFDRLPPPADAERDMLDLTYGVSAMSRLACQIVVKPELEGLTVRLPSTTRNMMD